MVIKTIVTTDMIDEIARQSNIQCYNVLTGFKWIAELIKEKEKTENYVIGGEESYGLMIGDKLRDKDAVSAVAILCEMAAYEKNKGKSFYDKLIDLYMKFGFLQGIAYFDYQKRNGWTKTNCRYDVLFTGISHLRLFNGSDVVHSTGLPNQQGYKSKNRRNLEDHVTSE